MASVKSTQPEGDANQGHLTNSSKGVPVTSIRLPIQWDVVYPHVQIRPVQNQKHEGDSKGSFLPEPGQCYTQTQQDLEDATGIYPEPRTTEDFRDDRLKPRRVPEVLNSYPRNP